MSTDDIFLGLNKNQLILEVFSIFSGICSASVILTAFLFPSLRKQKFVYIMANINWCTLLTSAGASIGFPSNDSLACTPQSIVVTFFSRASWFWITFLSLELHSLFMYRKNSISVPYMNGISWLLAAIVTFLPLINSTFGRVDNESIQGWCYLSGNDTDSNVITWTIVSLYAPLTICFVLTTIFWIRIRCASGWQDMYSDFPVTQTLSQTSSLYPLSLLMSWGLFTVISAFFNFSLYEDARWFEGIRNAATGLAPQLGTLMAFAFFLTSEEARRRWAGVFSCLCCCAGYTVETDNDLNEPLILESSDIENRFLGNNATGQYFANNSMRIALQVFIGQIGTRGSGKMSSSNRGGSNFDRFMETDSRQISVNDGPSPVMAKPSSCVHTH